MLGDVTIGRFVHPLTGDAEVVDDAAMIMELRDDSWRELAQVGLLDDLLDQCEAVSGYALRASRARSWADGERGR